MSYLDWREEFAKALDTRFYTIEFLDSLIASGDVKAIYGEKAAIVIEIKAFPSGAKVVSGVVEAGDPDEAELSLIPQAEAFGKSLGCQYGMIESRPAWARKMKKHGYEHFQTAIVKEL